MKHHIQLLILLLLPSMAMWWCGAGHSNDNSDTARRNEPATMLTSMMPDTVSRFDEHLGYMPEPCIDMKVNYLGHNYGLVFNDSNYIHRAEAEKNGIEPLIDLKSYWRNTRGIRKIVSCRDFYVEPLTYSRPFLTEKAADMLHEIGRRFHDSIDARGGGHYRIKVTSALRTPQSVARLRRHNVNAVDSSVHSLGTTIDISYAAFICDSASPARTVNDLKGVLSEVLYAMREEGKCLIKHERKQPCYHITVCDYAGYGPAARQKR